MRCQTLKHRQQQLLTIKLGTAHDVKAQRSGPEKKGPLVLVGASATVKAGALGDRAWERRPAGPRGRALSAKPPGTGRVTGSALGLRDAQLPQDERDPKLPTCP